MIEIGEAVDKLLASAKSYEALTDRLSQHIGSTLAIDKAHYHSSRERHIGVLEELLFSEQYDYQEMTYRFAGSTDAYESRLAYSYSVLLDGKWKIIHQGKSEDEDEDETTDEEY